MPHNGRASQPRLTKSHCPYCALNCGLKLETTDGRIDQMVRWKDSPLTGGALCSKGVTAHEQVHHADRLTVPLVRRGGDFVETSWDEALDTAAEGFLRIARQHGPAATAVLSGGSLTNEKVYLVGKLARLALGTPHVDYNGRFCMAAASAANMRAFGADRMMTPLAELGNAQLAVVIGSNISDAFPVVIPKALGAVRQRGGRVIVIDPRAARFVQPEDLYIDPRPGTDGALFGGLLREISNLGLLDSAFIRDRTNGFDEALRAVERWDPAAVESVTGVSPETLREAALLIGGADRCMYLHGRGPEQQLNGTENVSAIINVGLARGHVGRPGCGINMLTGQRNGQGGREWGQRCNQLPAGRSIENQSHRQIVAERWGVDAQRLPPAGRTYVEILQMAGRGEIKGLLTICTNMSVSAPDLHAVEAQMRALDHHVLIDPFFSKSAQHADVILPGSTFAEEEGTITTIEGRVVRVDQAVAPVAQRADIDVLRNLATRLGAGEHFNFHTASEVFDEMRYVSAGGPVDYSGMTYDRLRDEGGVFWPCPATTLPSTAHPGTPQLYRERFHHPDGKARFRAVDVQLPTQSTDDDYPLVLTTGRVLAQFLSGNQTGRIEAQNRVSPAPYVEIHPETATRFGIDTSSAVVVTSRQGESEIPWIANANLRRDTLFMPYHWVECNRLVAADLDPVSRMPGFKYTPVALRAAALSPESNAVDVTATYVGSAS